MGLFLQKTNIIRDYLEDLSEKPPRVWYPKEIWSKYAKRIEDFKEVKNSANAVACLNEMVVNALTHVPESLEYMKILKQPGMHYVRASRLLFLRGLPILCNPSSDGDCYSL